MERRGFLAAGAVLLPILASGCLHDAPSVRLPRIALVNGSPAEQRVELSVVLDGSTVLSNSYALPASDGVVAETETITDLPADQGSWTVTARVLTIDGQPRQTLDVDRWTDDCGVCEVRIFEDPVHLGLTVRPECE